MIITLNDNWILKCVACIVIYTAYSYVYSHLTLERSLVIALMFYTLALVIDYGIYVFIIYKFNNNGYIPLNRIGEGKLYVLFGKMIVIFIILLIRAYFASIKNFELEKIEWIKIVFSSVISIALIVVNILNFSFVSDVIRKGEKVKYEKLLNINKDNQITQYRMMSENYENQKKITHDYKNHIN